MSFEDPSDTTLAHERRITRCSSCFCRARIIWLKTRDGKNMPCDADSVEPEDEIYEYGRHISHWGTCKSAPLFRSSR